MAEGIRELVLRGASIRRAAAALGVASTTFERWRERARQGREPYVSTFEAFEIAEAVFLAGIEQTVAAAVQEDWRAGAWLLSKRCREDYGDAKEIQAREAKRVRDDRPPEQLTHEELVARIGEGTSLDVQAMTNGELRVFIQARAEMRTALGARQANDDDE